MENLEYFNIYKHEDKHFFYVVNHKIIIALVRKYSGDRPNLKILDAGCGTGLLAKKLEILGQVWAVDLSPTAVKLAKKRKIRVQQASVMKLPFPSKTFDVVTSVDVIYHRKVEDKKALKEFNRVLKPGGVLVLRVPALDFLRRGCDLQVHTRHRYYPSELNKLLKLTGFKVEKISFINLILLPFAFMDFLKEQFIGSESAHTPLISPPTFLNKILINFLSVEIFLINKFKIPLGLGLIAIGRKYE